MKYTHAHSGMMFYFHCCTRLQVHATTGSYVVTSLSSHGNPTMRKMNDFLPVCGHEAYRERREILAMMYLGYAGHNAHPPCRKGLAATK